MQLTEWLQDKATRAFTRFYHESVEEIEERVLENEDTVKVYWFSSDSALFGQATPFGTIILNRTRVDDLSTSTQELVLQHELSHIQRGSVARGIFYGMVFWGVLGILSALTFTGLLVAGAPLAALTDLGAFSALSIAIFVVTNRLEETTADLHALQAAGEDDFIAGYREVSAVSDDSIGTVILRALFYTRPERTVRLHRLLRHIGVVNR